MSFPAAEKRHLGRVDIDNLGYLAKGKGPNTCISLFTGCGGAALGVCAAGFEVRVMVEWDKAACDTLRGNWTRAGWERWTGDLITGKKPKWGTSNWHQKREPAIIQADITKISTAEILFAAGLRVGECTLLEGGFPCQGFSTANRSRNVSDHTTDKRNVLYQECVRVIREALPKSFFLENVPGLVSMEKGGVIRMIARDLAESGYKVTWQVLNAADYGVPQNRIRVFIMGERNDVLVIREDGTPEYHLGGSPGPIYHPSWYTKQYKLKLEPWEKTHDQRKGKRV